MLTLPMEAMPPKSEPGWQAALDVELRARDGRTFVSRREHRGPLQIQRAFHPEGPGSAHVYLLHPPGGVVAGDHLQIDLATRDGAHAVVTTPAATKLYRSRSPELHGRQTVRLHAAAGTRLEWLPQENIVFDGARVELSTAVELVGDAAFIGWEVVCLGRPASAERFRRGHVRQRFELARDGVPLALERLSLPGLDDGSVLDAAWGLRGAPVVGTMFATPVPAALEARQGQNDPSSLDSLRALTDGLPDGEHASVTLLDGVLVVRALGGHPERMRALFGRLWAALRPLLLGRPALAPRIWAT
jgi:urease accessory protein